MTLTDSQTALLKLIADPKIRVTGAVTSTAAQRAVRATDQLGHTYQQSFNTLRALIERGLVKDVGTWSCSVYKATIEGRVHLSDSEVAA